MHAVYNIWIIYVIRTDNACYAGNPFYSLVWVSFDVYFLVSQTFFGLFFSKIHGPSSGDKYLDCKGRVFGGDDIRFYFIRYHFGARKKIY